MSLLLYPEPGWTVAMSMGPTEVVPEQAQIATEAAGPTTSPAAGAAASVAPTVVLGSLTIPPNPAAAKSVSIDPLYPAPAAAAAARSGPDVALDSITVIVSPAGAKTGHALGLAVREDDTVVRPSARVSIATVGAPTNVVLDSITVTTDPTTAPLAAFGPVIPPAIASAAAVDPTVSRSGLTATPPAAIAAARSQRGEVIVRREFVACGSCFSNKMPIWMQLFLRGLADGSDAVAWANLTHTLNAGHVFTQTEGSPCSTTKHFGGWSSGTETLEMSVNLHHADGTGWIITIDVRHSDGEILRGSQLIKITKSTAGLCVGVWDLNANDVESSGDEYLNVDGFTATIQPLNETVRIITNPTIAPVPGVPTGEIVRLASEVVDMQTAGKTQLYVVPLGFTFWATKVVVKDTSASLAGGTDYNFGHGTDADSWKAGVDLSAMTSPGADYEVLEPDTTPAETPGGNVFEVKVNTGSTAAATAVIDVFGFHEQNA